MNHQRLVGRPKVEDGGGNVPDFDSLAAMRTTKDVRQKLPSIRELVPELPSSQKGPETSKYHRTLYDGPQGPRPRSFHDANSLAPSPILATPNHRPYQRPYPDSLLVNGGSPSGSSSGSHTSSRASLVGITAAVNGEGPGLTPVQSVEQRHLPPLLGRGMNPEFDPSCPAFQHRHSMGPIPAHTGPYPGPYPGPYQATTPPEYVGPYPSRLPYSSSLSLEPAGEYGDGKQKRRRGNLPKPVTDILRDWFQQHVAHPYPTEEEKQALMHQTGLSISQISNWFINARRRSLPQMTRQAQAEAEIRDSQMAV